MYLTAARRTTVSLRRFPGTREEVAARADAKVARAVLMFARIEFFVLIYLQKFAFGGNSFALSVPMLATFFGVGLMLMFGYCKVAAERMMLFGLFVAACLFSAALNNGSLPSLGQVVLMYACYTVIMPVTEAMYLEIVRIFNRMMVPPAILCLISYFYQTFAKVPDPINLEHFVPMTFLMSGFHYASNYPWNSIFTRPNGLFFLEPSFLSLFTATSVILEVLYLRRLWMIVLMTAATCYSLGATGISMLIIAAPFLLARESPKIRSAVVAAGVLFGMGMAISGKSLPLLNRTDELSHSDSSGSARLMVPASMFVLYVFDPTGIFIGNGAGTTPSEPGTRQKAENPWPIVKVVYEYGLMALIFFLAFYFTGINGNFNIALKVALTIEYLVTGGYLLSPVMVILLQFFCFNFIPNKQTWQ